MLPKVFSLGLQCRSVGPCYDIASGNSCDDAHFCAVCDRLIWCNIHGEFTDYTRCQGDDLCLDCHTDLCRQSECWYDDADPVDPWTLAS